MLIYRRGRYPAQAAVGIDMFAGARVDVVAPLPTIEPNITKQRNVATAFAGTFRAHAPDDYCAKLAGPRTLNS